MTFANTGSNPNPNHTNGAPSSRPNLAVWLAAGAIVWLFATLGLAWIGDAFLERGMVIYIAFSLAASGAFIAIFALLARLLGLNRSTLLPAAAAFSIAGMVGEVFVMVTFPMLVPALSASVAGPFAAFLFFGYSALLCFALIRSR